LIRRASVVVLALAACAGIVDCAKARHAEVAISAPDSSPAATGSPAGDPQRGRIVFGKNCSVCHGATGEEGGTGPSLRGESTRQTPSVTVAWIKNPRPPMPKLYPAPLSRRDVVDVAAYVQGL
jgi:mono/diheme cytochrome c family protein